MENLRTRVIEGLKQAGWRIALRPSNHLELPDEVKTRYPHIPSSLTDFLSGLEYCTNPDETAWFLCAGDFAGTGQSAWRWNDFEIMEREEAETEDGKAIVTRFWDSHIPFLLSVRTGYSFFAMNVEGRTSGKVVQVLMEYGVKEPTYVSSTLEEFLQELIVTTETGEGRFSADV